MHAPRPAPIACRLFHAASPLRAQPGPCARVPNPRFRGTCSTFSNIATKLGPPLTPFSPPASPSTGLQPTDLYGKFTWKIENFSEISKRELRSNVFEVGSYKWCA